MKPESRSTATAAMKEWSAILKLTFSRHAHELEQAILQSFPAEAAAVQGMDLKPEWARGAKILTGDVDDRNFDEELGPYNVVLNERDEEVLMEALAALPYRYRRLKAGVARALIPDQYSLFGQSSSSGICSMMDDSAAASSSGGAEIWDYPEITAQVQIRRVCR